MSTPLGTAKRASWASYGVAFSTRREFKKNFLMKRSVVMQSAAVEADLLLSSTGRPHACGAKLATGMGGDQLSPPSRACQTSLTDKLFLCLHIANHIRAEDRSFGKQGGCFCRPRGRDFTGGNMQRSTGSRHHPHGIQTAEPLPDVKSKAGITQSADDDNHRLGVKSKAKKAMFK